MSLPTAIEQLTVTPPSGPPSFVSVTGHLRSEGIPLMGKRIDLYIRRDSEPSYLYKSQNTYADGSFWFEPFAVVSGSYVFTVLFVGDASYLGSNAASGPHVYESELTSLSIDISPDNGEITYDAVISGRLDADGIGLGGQTIQLWESLPPTDAYLGSTTTTAFGEDRGEYSFDFLMNIEGTVTLYVAFQGTQQYEASYSPNKSISGLYLNSRPQATITASTQIADIYTDILFSGVESTDDRGVVSYEWDFGDGSELRYGPSVLHRYQEPGTYNVALTVTDGEGLTDTAILSIGVTEGEEPPGPLDPQTLMIGAIIVVVATVAGAVMMPSKKS